MKLYYLAFSARGLALAENLAAALVGAAVRCGAVCGGEFYEDLAADTLQRAGIPFEKLPENVEKTIREDDGRRFVFLFNNGEEARAFSHGGKTVTLRPYEAAVFKERK